MSEPEKPKRRWQFHLSTLVVSILALGTLLGLNSCSQYDGWHRRCYGFPMTMLMVPTPEYAQQRRDTLKKKESSDWIPVGSATNFENDRLAPLYHSEFSWLRALGNLLILVFCLYATLAGTNFLIRRREGRKT